MKTTSFKAFADKLFIPVVIAAYILVLAVSFIAKTNPWIWYDEAAQVWIAKGLNLDSPPLSPEGGIADVIRNNHDYNLDPGGFGIIIHFWQKISDHYLWLRALPFLFFILTMLCSAYLGFKWTRDRNMAFIMALVPCTVPLLFHEAFEIRAYSMEVTGVYVVIIGLLKLSEKLRPAYLMAFSLALSFFLTSRYSFVPVAFVASLYVLYLIFRSDKTARTKVLYSVAYALPLFFTLFAIYMMAMRVQNPAMESLGYLIYLRSNPIYLFKEASACFLLLPAFVIWLGFKPALKDYFRKYRPLVYMLLVSTAVFMILSFLGFHPWFSKLATGRFASRYCISLITLATITISAIVCELKTLTKSKYLLLFLVVFQFVYTNADDIRHFRDRDTCLTEYQSVMSEDALIFIDRAESPAMRYLFEYGALKGTRKNYPEGITFTTADKHCYTLKEDEKKIDDFEAWCMSFPPLNEMMQYDILIVPELKTYKPEDRFYWHELGKKGVFVKRQF